MTYVPIPLYQYIEMFFVDTAKRLQFYMAGCLDDPHVISVNLNIDSTNVANKTEKKVKKVKKVKGGDKQNKGNDKRNPEESE